MNALHLDDLATSWNLQDKTVLVTGATSGIGQRSAHVLAAVGANIAVAGRRQDRLDELTEQIPGSTAHVTDLADLDHATRLVDNVVQQHGTIDVVINCAGTTNLVPATKEHINDWNRVLNINLTAPFLIARAAANHMINANTPGSIVNITSVIAHRSAKLLPQASYAASKAGLDGLTRELAVQLGPHQIRVNAIAPGIIETEMTAPLTNNAATADNIAAKTALGRIGNVTDLDHALLLLATNAGSFITGTTITIDGGSTAGTY